MIIKLDKAEQVIMDKNNFKSKIDFIKVLKDLKKNHFMKNYKKKDKKNVNK